MANTHEHLEHAEHNAHDPFNQRVAVSMAIVAAILAGISMIGHRTHNMVLQLQGDSNRLRTEAATAEVEKSNLFAWYQAKKVRQSQYETIATTLERMPGIEVLSKDADPEAKKKAAERADARAKDAADMKQKAAEYYESNKDKDNLPDLMEQGKAAGKRAEEMKERARIARDESDHAHHQAERLDIAHLSSELGLVLCSIALLTKKKGYWFAGLAAAVVAIGLTVSAYTIAPESHGAHEVHEVPSSAAPDDKGKPH